VTPGVEREAGRLSMGSGGRLLAAAIVEHPEVCKLAESLVAEIVGRVRRTFKM
jgi:hypothetical protein